MELINSIFKHSEGYVMQRYANNENEHHVTDIYGTPEDGKHILSEKHGCSDKGEFNIAIAYRQGKDGAHGGFCYKDGGNNIGQKYGTSNCICNDRSDSIYFNQCAGDYGNLRRYNGKRSRNKFCNYMNGKCSSYPHGVLGDSQGCDVPGQRHIGGHFWVSLSGRTGAACRGYNTYGCYGSRWIA